MTRPIALSGSTRRPGGIRRIYRRPDGTVAWWDGGAVLETNRRGHLRVDPSWSVERMAMYLDDHAICIPFHT